MGLPVTVYRYTDPGAPQITNGTPSEWINVLKKVLVEGYGSKAALGWTLEFENAGAFKVAFRNNVAEGGSGGYVQFWSSYGSNSANEPMKVKCALGMTALDTFIKAGPGRQIFNTGNMRGWEIIGTSRGFYFTVLWTYPPIQMGISTSSSGYHNCYFIGDIDSKIANDNNCFTLVDTINTTSDSYGSSQGIASSSNLYMYIYSVTGEAIGGPHVGLKSLFSFIDTSLDGNAEALGVDHNMFPAHITTEIANNNANTSISLPYFRGFVPGLYYSSFAGYRNENWPKELVRDGITWVLLRAYVATRYWIKTGTWYD